MASTEAPLVTLAVPVFNGGRYLSECLASLAAQSHAEIEVVISDNASTDATEEIARSFARSDERIRYHRYRENRGAAANYNFCVNQARGSYFAWTGHDDLRPQDFVSASLESFQKTAGHASVVVGTSDFIDEEGMLIGPDLDFHDAQSDRPYVRLGQALRSLNFARPVFGLIRRDLLAQTRLIDGFAASDFVLIAELAMLGKIVATTEPMLARRLHPASSREANRTRAQVREWFDPSAGIDRLSDRQRLWVEYQRSVGQLGMAWPDRLLCRVTIPTVMSARRAQVIGGAWKNKITRRSVQPHARDVMAARNQEA